MGASGKKLPQPFAGARNGIGPRHADDVKTLGAGGLGEAGLQLGWRQKSRSA
jgi:hypothetical protein